MSSTFISMTLARAHPLSTLLIFFYHYLMMHSKWDCLLCAERIRYLIIPVIILFISIYKHGMTGLQSAVSSNSEKYDNIYKL